MLDWILDGGPHHSESSEDYEADRGVKAVTLHRADRLSPFAKVLHVLLDLERVVGINAHRHQRLFDGRRRSLVGHFVNEVPDFMVLHAYVP